MKRNLSIVSICLLFVLLSCEKNADNDKDLLEIFANKTLIQADGLDEVEFSVFLNGEELVYGYKIICDNVPIEGKRFTTDKEDRYSFVATREDVVSNVVMVQSTKAKIPEKPSDFSTAPKSLLTFVPGMMEPYSFAERVVNNLMDSEITRHTFTLVTVPNFACRTNSFPQTFYAKKIGCDRAPFVAINNHPYESIQLEPLSLELLQEKDNRKNTAANIGINSILDTNDKKTLITRVLLKAKVDANYYVGAFLVEDNIYLGPSEYQYYDAVIRHIDSGDNVVGNKVGFISKEATGEYMFVWDIDNIRDVYNASENNWSDFVNKNLRVVVYVYTENGDSNTDKYQFNNVTESLVETVDMES